MVITALAHADGGVRSDAPTEVPSNVGMAMANKRLHEAERLFQQTGSQYYPSPYSWADEVVYQIVVDRFNDGDPSNNQKNIEAYQRANQSGSQSGLPDYRHGGDLKGITKRLGYLKDLGITSLWITPILKTSGSYHGYCTSDYTDVDPGFGTRDDLRELTREAHRKGIRVVMDIVVNHLCNNDTHYNDSRTPFDNGYYNMCLNDLSSKEWTGGPNDPRGQRDLVFGKSFFEPLRNRHYFSRCGFKSGDAYGAGPAAVFGDFSGLMLDFNTMNWDFQKIFTAYHKAWIAEADVDGFRLDAAKHVTPDFTARFSTAVREYARALGKQNFFIVGEVADNTSMQANYVGKMKSEIPQENMPAVSRNILPSLADTYRRHPVFPYPGLNAVYDFSHSGLLREVFQGRAPLRRLKNYFWNGGETENNTCGSEFCQLAFNGDTNLNWNLIEIHDWPRFLVTSRDGYRYRAALGYLMTTQGTPIIYYGMEQGLDGQCHLDRTTVTDSNTRRDIENVCHASDFNNHGRYRQDMFASGPWRLGSIVPEIESLAGIGIGTGRSNSNDSYARTDHGLYKYVRKLIAVRKSCLPLRRGQIYFRAAHDSAEGLLAFSRIADGQENLVIINSGFNDIAVDELTVDANLHGGSQGQRFKNLFNEGEQGEIIRNGSGGISVNFGRATGHSFIAKSRTVSVFVPETAIAGYDSYLDVSLCK